MTTLAEAFLYDYEETVDQVAPLTTVNDIAVTVITVDMDADSDAADDADAISDLLASPELAELLNATRELLGRNPAKAFGAARAEDSAEYRVILRATAMSKRLEEQIFAMHRHCCDLYASRFAELEQTVLHPVHYARVVRAVGNQIVFYFWVF